MSTTIQNQISELLEISGQNDALINLLTVYCENFIDSPTPENLFDVNAGLKQIKANSVIMRKDILNLNELSY